MNYTHDTVYRPFFWSIPPSIKKLLKSFLKAILIIQVPYRPQQIFTPANKNKSKERKVELILY